MSIPFRLWFSMWLAASLPFAAAQEDDGLDLPVSRPQPESSPGQVQLAPLATRLAAPPATPPTSTPNEYPYPVFFGEEIPSHKLILVLDTSQSMFDASGRIEAARREVCRLIQALPPVAIFDVILFTSDRASVLWPRGAGPHEGMQPANEANKAAAIAFVSAPVSGGNTPAYEGVRAALAFLENDHVVVLTDGAPTGATPWAPLELDPRVYGRGWVPGVLGSEAEYLSARVLPDGTSLVGPTLEHEYMIRRENHVVRPAAGARPARIDVFGIDVQGGGWERENARWFCGQVAARNGGTFVPVSCP